MLTLEVVAEKKGDGNFRVDIGYGDGDGMNQKEVVLAYFSVRQAAKHLGFLDGFDDIVNRGMALDPDDLMDAIAEVEGAEQKMEVPDDESAGV